MAKTVIDEEFLGQIELLQTLIKNNVAGMFGGNHKSKTYGSSCEFADYREYTPGDDITKIDWNAFARFEKLYTKLYLDERQMHTRIYIDASYSMGYGKGKKDEQALKLAAAFAYLSVCEMDKVSVYSIRDRQLTSVINGMLGKEAFINSVGAFNNVEFGGDSFISEAIVPSTVGYGDGLSIIISDFLTDNDFEAAIDHLAGKKRHVLCVQLLSREELTPKLRGKMHLFDSEDSGKYYRKNITREIVKAYHQALDFVTGRIRGYCAARGADYMLVCAEDPLNKIFFENLVTEGVIK
ncbi:MAG: DUF58 domain-containing protein [Clostridia bacterium]|nr:DUF58 domain-containing protein [Clostridia bacterium]